MASRSQADKVRLLQQQVDEVKDIMLENMEKSFQRQERIETIQDMTEELVFEADAFRKTSKKLERKLWYQNIKLCACIAILVVVIILLLGGGAFLAWFFGLFGKLKHVLSPPHTTPTQAASTTAAAASP